MLGLKPELWPGNLGEEGQGSRVKAARNQWEHFIELGGFLMVLFMVSFFFNLKCSISIFGVSPTKILGYLRMLSRPQSDEGVWREVKSHKIHGINDGNSLGF